MDVGQLLDTLGRQFSAVLPGRHRILLGIGNQGFGHQEFGFADGIPLIGLRIEQENRKFPAPRLGIPGTQGKERLVELLL